MSSFVGDNEDYQKSFDMLREISTGTVATYKNCIKRLPISENTLDYQWKGWYIEPDGAVNL